MDNVDFLTKEHSKTLGGLHREIQKLQGRCDELTYKLHFTDNNPENESDGTFSQNNIEMVECLKAQLEDVTKSLGTELHRKNEIIKDLHNQLLAANTEIQDISEKHMRSQASLEAKAKTIAFLTAKLHQVKTKLAAKHSEPIVPSPPPPQKLSLEKTRKLRRSEKSEPIKSSVFFAEENLDSACFRSLPPSLDPITSPKLFVPTPPADTSKRDSSYPRHTRRYSAPRLRTNSANESLPLALLPEEKIHMAHVPAKSSKKLILPPIPSTSRETQSKNGPMVGNLQSPEGFKHPQKTSQSARVKDF